VGLAYALVAFALGAPFGGGPAPTVAVESFRATVTTSYGSAEVAWRAPEDWVARRSAENGGDVAELGAVTVYGATPGYPGSIVKRTFAAQPDGYSEADVLRTIADHVLGEARGGRLELRRDRAGGRPAWKARFALAANECAGAPKGTGELWLDRETLLPLRYVERRQGREAAVWRYAYRDVGADLPGALFARPKLGDKPLVRDLGFVRRAPARPAGSLSYVPLLPSLVPEGFELAVSGSAPLSGRTGPEASNPRYRDLFAAVYRRGFERIEITQRAARSGGWPSDPFGAECQRLREEQVTVRGADAVFATAPGATPHLYWRKGKLLFTVSGPFPKDDLVAIAESLAPLAS
jgi:hypothetical protein